MCFLPLLSVLPIPTQGMKTLVHSLYSYFFIRKCNIDSGDVLFVDEQEKNNKNLDNNQ